MSLSEYAAFVRDDRRDVQRDVNAMCPIARAEYELATAYAAELDETPIDVEWLKSLGFGMLRDDGVMWHAESRVCMDQMLSDKSKSIMSTDTCDGVVSTRGEFLTYLRLWGIKLWQIER